LSRLVTDGLVESEDQRGFCVAPASIEELMDLSQTRSWVEHAALCMAIQNGDVEWESTVLASFHRLSRLQDPTAAPHAAPVWRAAHRQFHLSLVEGCKSPWTVKLCAMLFDQTERYRNLAGRAPRIRERDVLGEHKRLMEAVLSRNTELATQILSAHFKHTTDLILEGGLLASPPRRPAARRG
jgi:DNA-binding GntR family transcriptional regulator